MEKVSYMGLPNCVRLANDVCEVVATTDLGPRLVRYALHDAENMLGEAAQVVLTTALGDWKPWGGHRLWAAPEAMPRSYAPDNDAVDYTAEGAHTVRLVAPTEAEVGIQKEMRVTLAETGSRVTIEQRITNRGQWAVELAPWGITIMRGGGEVIIPQEPFRTWSQELLPARPLVLWHYTEMSDARFTFGARYIRLRTDARVETPQKIGALCKQGWAAYRRGRQLFVKRFPYIADATYPDYGCNVETYTAGDYVELETLAPLQLLAPGAHTTHVEDWHLFAGFDHGATEDDLHAAIAPLIAQTHDIA